VQDRPGHDRRYATTSKKIEDELGWKPATRLDEGLRQTIEWYSRIQNGWRTYAEETIFLTTRRITSTETLP
jgi:dTDP-D-glucose 4,6-dehydratase